MIAMSEHSTHERPLFERAIVLSAVVDSFKKLDPRRMVKNPVMFVVEVGSAFTTALFAHAAITRRGDANPGFILAISPVVLREDPPKTLKIVNLRGRLSDNMTYSRSGTVAQFCCTVFEIGRGLN